MSQKLHEQNAQEIANNQIVKLANENKLLESKLVLAETLKEDVNIKLQQAINKLESSRISSSYEHMKAENNEKRADFNGKIAGWSVAANVALVACFLFYLGVI